MAYSPAPQAGGFILPPSPSSLASTALSSTLALPQPRTEPLRPGGAKWSALIRYVDTRLLHIQRRFSKRTTPIAAGLSDEARDAADAWGDVKGYRSMTQACRDLRQVVRIVWTSGTPSLQVPYLINIATLLGSVIAGMPPTPNALFALLGLLDRAFAGLLQGRDVESGAELPGFAGTKGVSGTEKVRIRSLVERTRVGVMEAFKRGEFDLKEADSDVEHTEGELVVEGDDDDMDDGDSWDMQLARVYDRTMVELGDSLEQPNLGIITEGRGWQRPS